MKGQLNEIGKPVNLILLLQISLVLIFDLFTKRGLSLDGAHNLIRMITAESFYFLELSRQSSYLFQQLPAYLMIQYTNFSSLDFLILVFSFGLIWLHILSLLGCFLILPYEKKRLIFFPLLFFITGPLTALGIPISASLSAASCIWLSVFVIYYSDLSKRIHQILFLILPLSLFLSHEIMSYMAPVLIFFCVLKLNFKEPKFKKSNLNFKPIKSQKKLLVYFVIICLLFNCLLSWFFLFFPMITELPNRAEFFTSLLKLEFLFKWEEGKSFIIYPATVIASLILAFPFILKPKTQPVFSKLLLLGLFLFGCFCAAAPFNNKLPFFKLTGEEELRVWVCCIALPLSLLIWYLFEKRILKLDKVFIKAFLFTALCLTLWRVGSDYQFYKLQKQISKTLENCYGIISYDDSLKKRFSKLSNDLYHTSSYSLLFQDQIQSLFSLHPSFDSKISKLYFNDKKLPDSLIGKNPAVCYFGQEHPYMCRFFNLETLNQSRFFNLNQLIQNIQNGVAGCKKRGL